MLNISPERRHLYCVSQEKCHSHWSTTNAKISKPTWKTLIRSMIFFGKILSLILDMTTESDYSADKTNLPISKRLCVLILCVCLIYIVRPKLIPEQNNTDEKCRQNNTTQRYGFQHCPAILNNVQCPDRFAADVVDGDENDAPSARVCKYDLTTFTLFHVVHLEVASMNSNGHLNKNVHRVYLFTLNDCTTWGSTAKDNVGIVIYIITTSGDVIEYLNHPSNKDQMIFGGEVVLSNYLRSARCLSLKIFSLESIIYENVETGGLDINCEVKYSCYKQTLKLNKITIGSAAEHPFSVNQKVLQTVFGGVNMYTEDTHTLLRVFRIKRSTEYIGLGIKHTCVHCLHGHNDTCQSAMRNDVIKLKCLPGENKEQRLQTKSNMSKVEIPSAKHLERTNSVGHDCLNGQSAVGTERSEVNVKMYSVIQSQDLKDLINNIQRLYRGDTFRAIEQHSIAIRVRAFQYQNDEKENVSSCLPIGICTEIPEHKCTQQQNQTTKDVEHKCNGKRYLKHILKDTSSVCISAPRICIVAPVTRNEHCAAQPQVDVLRKLCDVVERTLKRESVPAQESMVFELLRICTFRTFPKNDKPDVGAFAAAGFYYASQNDEVICYCCYKRISNWGKSDDPSAVHVRISPECKFHTSNSEVNVSKAVTESVQSDILAKLQGNKSSSNATNSHNTALSMSMVPTRVIDGKRSIATGQNYESRVAMNSSQKTHTNHAFSIDSLPPTSRPPNATGRFKSMIPQTFSANTASSKTSRFQTGKFVSSLNFAIPDSNTKSIQPEDDAIEPGITIDEYIYEYNSGSNVGNKSISKASTQTTDTGLNGIVESLITSEASVIVQGMGNSSSLIKQALSRLVNKGKTKPGPQDIMQEIFHIEDE